MYNCNTCGFSTHIKTHYRTHIQTKKHKNNISKYEKSQNIDYKNVNTTANNVSNISTMLAKISTNESMSYCCNYCGKYFSTRSSKSRHQSKYCKKNDQANVNKLVQLLNDKEEKLNAKDEQIIERNDKIQKLEAKIEKLMETVQAKYVNNGTHVEGNQQNIANIQLLNYNKTDYDFLTDNDYIRCFMDNNHCVKKLIEKVHFNPTKPENMNVYISCIKVKYVMVYRDNTWQIRDRQKQIDDLYETNELMLENWYDEYKQTYPDIIKSFTRYLKNKTNDTELIRSVKDEILMMLYNKRDMIQD